MIGTPTKLSVHVSRKKWSDEMGSFEVAAGLEVELGPKANLEQAFDEADTWLTAAVGQSVADKIQKISPKELEPKPTGMPEQPSEEDYETEQFAVDSITVQYSPNGLKMAKVKGGKWKKYGVTCWPEVLNEIDFDLDNLDAADYPMQPGYVAIALMENGKPKKVIEFV